MIKLTKAEKQKLSEDLKTYFEEVKVDAEQRGESFSQNMLATKMGVSSGLIGYIFDPDKHDKTNQSGNPMLTDKIWSKVRNFLGASLEVWDTDNYRKAMNALMECKLNRAKRIIDGITGTGKSFVCEQFIKQYPSETFLVTCASDHNPKQFMIELGKAVGLKNEDLGGTRYDIRIKICERLFTLSRPFIIVDEVENAKPAVIGALKDTYDYKKLFRHVGIAVFGANGYIESIKEKMQNKVKHSYPQYFRRFKTLPIYLDPYSQKEGFEICRQYYGIDIPTARTISQSAEDLGDLAELINSYLADQKLSNDKKDAA